MRIKILPVWKRNSVIPVTHTHLITLVAKIEIDLTCRQDEIDTVEFAEAIWWSLQRTKRVYDLKFQTEEIKDIRTLKEQRERMHYLEED